MRCVTILTLFLLYIVFFPAFSQDEEEAIVLQDPYERTWTKEIIGSVFENQRTSPLISIDDKENVYVAGSFSGELQIGKDQTLKSRGDTDIFLVKYDINGNLLWKKQAGGIGKDYVASMQASHEGGVVLAGHFEDSTSFGRIRANIDKGGYVASYNADGTILWVKTENKTLYAIPQTDRQGNLYLTEAYKDKIAIDSMQIVNPTRYYNSYIAKFDDKDQLQWLTIINQMDMNGRGEVKTSDVAIDEKGNVFVGGTIKYAPVFDNIQIRSGKEDDVFLAKYNNEGQLNWVLQLTNSDDKYEVDRVFIKNYTTVCVRATAYAIEGSDTTRSFHQFEYNQHATSVEYHTFFGWESGEDITGDSLNYQYTSFVESPIKKRLYKVGIIGDKLMVMRFTKKDMPTVARKEEESEGE